jgi:MOSC domain-containing protein YiiM
MKRVLAVSVGKVAPLFTAQEAVQSAIRKTPVSTLAEPVAVTVATLGIEGDEQADLRVHGGPRMAVYMYPYEHYPVWKTMRKQALKVEEDLPFGFMGENLTVQGLLETDVYVGDQIHIGEHPDAPVLVVTDPRVPCFKFNARMGFKHAAKMMTQSGYSGWYCAVFRDGVIQAGDVIRVVPGERAVRIDEKHRMLNDPGQDDLF